MNKTLIRLLVGGLGVALAAATATANAQAVKENTKRVEQAPDRSWVSISGTVTSTTPSTFRLDYGNDEVITVEMDDFDFFKEGRALMENDQVVVYGRIDDDMFERRTIEASSVYVENLGTHFYANAADEESFAAWTVAVPLVVGKVEVTGIIKSVDEREFIIATGAGNIEVDTASMPFNPMDDVGYLKLDVGDRVKVSGHVDNDLFDQPELSADWLIELGQ